MTSLLGKHRAAAFSAMLLATATGLASWLVIDRSNDAALGDRIRPETWTVSVQAPAGWEVADGASHGVLNCVVFTERGTEGRRRVVFVGRRQASRRAVEENAAAFLQEVEYQGILGMLTRPSFQAVPRIRDVESVAIQDPRGGSLAIARVMPDGWAYCGLMSFDGVDPERSDLRLLEQVIQSLEIVG